MNKNAIKVLRVKLKAFEKGGLVFFVSSELFSASSLSQRRRDSFHHKTQHNTTNFYFSNKTQNTLADSQSAKRNNPLLPRSLYQ